MVESAGLENRCCASNRGFESHSLRQKWQYPSGAAIFDMSGIRTRALKKRAQRHVLARRVRIHPRQPRSLYADGPPVSICRPLSPPKIRVHPKDVPVFLLSGIRTRALRKRARRHVLRDGSVYIPGNHAASMRAEDRNHPGSPEIAARQYVTYALL